MKKLLLIFSLGFLNFSSSAQSEKEITAKIKEVMVYQEGAQVSRKALVDLKKGKTTLVFSNLSVAIDPKSVQVKGTNGLTIVSVSQSIDYLNKATVSVKIQKLEDRKKIIRDSLRFLKGIKQVYLQEKKMVLTNMSIGGRDGVNISELKNAAAFFRSRLTEIENKKRELDQAKYTLNLEFIEIAKQLLELNATSDLETSSVKVVVSAKSQLKSDIELKYIVSKAGWIPNYDIRIADINKPMNLFYKAKVFQSSGEDWKNVNLTLSTGNPSISNYKPNLEPYYLSFNNYYRKPAPTYNNQNRPFDGQVTGQVTDDTGETLPGVSVVIKGTTTGTVTDIDGNYKLTLPKGYNTLVYSFVGFKNYARRVKSGFTNIMLETDTETLDEVVVTALAGKVSGVNVASNSSYRRKPAKKKEHIPLAIQKRQTNTEFKIKIPYSIPSDNHKYDVTMVEYEVEAIYSYSAVPKLSDDAFLTAKITDWTQYNMLSGNVNLFFEGVFQGETFLDLKSFEDTLSVSVGRDNDIVIKREIQKDFSSSRSLGSYKKELKSWEITIKNNKENLVNIKVEDQFPVSKINEIKVEQIVLSGAKIDKDSGKLSWDFKLAAKEKKTLIIKYSVKYPKYKKVIVD